MGETPSRRERRPQVIRVGFTQLSTQPADHEIIADVVFVHGLGGHPQKTWTYTTKEPTSRREQAKERPRNLLARLKRFLGNTTTQIEPETEISQQTHVDCFWPADFLARDFPNIRVLTYGYDSDISHFCKSPANQMTISQRARTLLEALTDQRFDCSERPIIFVVHSLGGLLVKDVIIESRKYNPPGTTTDDIFKLSGSYVLWDSTPWFWSLVLGPAAKQSRGSYRYQHLPGNPAKSETG